MLSLIVAWAGNNRIIGKDGDLPWHFKSDLKFFKETTMGHEVIMGRVTHQSIMNRLGKPLPGRQTIVVTRDVGFRQEGVLVSNDLPALCAMKAQLQPQAFVIGGAEIYRQTINHAQRLYVTEIEKEIEGDTSFPAFDASQWRRTVTKTEEENGTTLRFCVYDRINA